MENASTLDEVDLNHLLVCVQDRIKSIYASSASRWGSLPLGASDELRLYQELEEKILKLLDD